MSVTQRNKGYPVFRFSAEAGDRRDGHIQTADYTGNKTHWRTRAPSSVPNTPVRSVTRIEKKGEVGEPFSWSVGYPT